MYNGWNNCSASQVTVNTVLTGGQFDKIVMSKAKFEELQRRYGHVHEVQMCSVTIADNPGSEALRLRDEGFNVVVVHDDIDYSKLPVREPEEPPPKNPTRGYLFTKYMEENIYGTPL